MKKSSLALLSVSALAALLVITNRGAAQVPKASSTAPDFRSLALAPERGLPAPEVCGPDKKPVVYLAGVQDNFARPVKPVTLSPDLKTFFQTHKIQPRQFDQPGANLNFGHSFKIMESCKICAVQIEIKMKDQGDSYPNDRVYMFGKTIDAAGLIWLAPQGSGGTGAQGSSVLTSWLTQSAITRLNNLMCSSPPGGYWINITAQDDHEIDYVKLSIWYY